MKYEQTLARTGRDDQTFAGRWRIVWLIVAWLSFVLGLVALAIPGIPTTEFILLSAYAASKGSPRFHGWLCRHRLFGPMIRNWENGKLVSRTAKLSASLAMSACLVVVLLFVPNHWVVLLLALVLTSGAIWMWRRPEPPERG